MRAAALLLLLVAVPGPLQAADTWTHAANEHFEVYTTGGDRQARQTLTYFARVRAFFTDFLKLSPAPGKPTRLIVFSNDRQFAPFRPNEFAAAFYQAGHERDYIVIGPLEEDAYPVVVHEYAHLILRHSGGTYPVWLNEGLAEFFSTMAPQGGRMSIGRVPQARLQYLMDRLELLPLERLFDVAHGSPEYNTRRHAGTFYSQSWALTHMLLTDDRYRPRSSEFLKAVTESGDSAGAIERVWGKPIAAIESDLRSYVRQGSYLYFLADYKSPRADKVTPRTLDRFEGDLVATELLGSMREREEEARAAFERLETQRPGDVALLEARAAFELRRGRPDDARPLLAKAVAAGSSSPVVLRDYADLEPSRAPDLLARALQLDPRDLTTRLRYARVLVRERRSREALAVLTASGTIPRESAFELFQLMANAYAETTQLEDAKNAAVRAAQYASTPAESDYAARLIRSIDEYSTRRAAAALPPVIPAAAPPAGPSTTPVAGAVGGSARLSDLIAQQAGEHAPIVVTGRIVNMICGAEAPIIEVATASEIVRLRIDDGSKVNVQGAAGDTVDLHCGKQDVPVRAGYEPAADGAQTITGYLRLLDYRAQTQ